MTLLTRFQKLDFNDAAPAMEAIAVTPSDSVDLPQGIARSLYIGGAGNVVLDTYNNTSITFAGLAAGTILPVQAKRVRATSTTATLIVALY